PAFIKSSPASFIRNHIIVPRVGAGIPRPIAPITDAGGGYPPPPPGLYPQHNNQTKEESPSVFPVSDRAALIDRRPFDPPPRDKPLKPAVEKPKKTVLTQDQFRRGPKVAN